MNKKILVVGSANVDMVVKSERFPDKGETIIGGKFYKSPGGKGANQAVAAARLGADVTFICKVGNDDFGKSSLENYRNEGIETDCIILDPEHPTGVALISVNEIGENKIVVAPGANADFTIKDLEKCKSIFKEAEFIVLQLEIPLEVIGEILKLSQQFDSKVILNPAPAQSLPEWFYRDLYLITPNQTETEQLVGITVNDESSALKAANELKSLGVKNIVITMGEKGAFVLTDDFTGMIKAPKVKVEDTTAAGDVFNGTLAVALTEYNSWKAAVNFACNSAALSVTKIGAQSSAPTLNELNALMNSNKQIN